MWSMRWCTSKWTLSHRRRERGGGYNTSSLISLSKTFHTMPDKKITILDKIRRMNWMRNTSRQIVVVMLLHLCLHDFYIGGSQSFSNQQGIRIFVSSYFFNGSFYVLAYPLCLNIRHRYCVTVKICISFVFIGQKCCVHSCVNRHSCMYARYVYESTYRVYSV